ncbi:NADP-dependent phosphogluconate dehydrogenase [Roseovarius salis]|uniref:NADP-dependent phosphogluconate dehydrogenase n=1 Tax=Roseovarius salis TaxID=3376063 RepID=UPI0037CC46B1
MARAEIGIYGLGTMGGALALNMAEKGLGVAISNREADWIDPFMNAAGDLAQNLYPRERIEDFVAALARPRAVMFMIPSGPPLDNMIAAIAPLLSRGDTIVDGGNADFHDTRRRAAQLAESGLHFVGMGVSGGQHGARHGPSLMVGGPEQGWQRLAPVLRAIAARYEGDPCVARLGPDGAGHFVKTVHNGIEYAEMQMIAEVYGLMRHGAARPPAEIGRLFADWNDGPLASYLLGITAKILQTADPATGHPVIDVIKDAADQKGTGRWTVVEALNLGQSASMIEAAVGARSWSAEKQTRQAIQARHGGARGGLEIDDETLAEAMMAARILGHAQGFRVVAAASAAYHWRLDSARIAEIWRAGCIIRSAFLDDVAAAFRAGLPAGELILSPALAQRLGRCVPALRGVVASAVAGGHAVPALAAALQWFDTMRQGHGTANLIQAQRDWFGRHGFERLGHAGRVHGPWLP